MSLAYSARPVAASRRPAAAAAAAPRQRRRSGRSSAAAVHVRADLHGLVAVSHGAALFPPSRQMSGASTPSQQRPGSSLSHGAPADPSKREAFARVLRAGLTALVGTSVLAADQQRGAGQQHQQQQPLGPQRSASPALQLPPEVLEAEEEALESSSSSGGWGRSHIAERLAMQRVSVVAPPLDEGGH